MAEQFCIPIEFGRTKCVSALTTTIVAPAVTATNMIVAQLEVPSAEETSEPMWISERTAGTSFKVATKVKNFSTNWFINWAVYSS